jgi:NAD(P)-dependent dehydrogenase (short-subunit alcohol dehydrogenase family)
MTQRQVLLVTGGSRGIGAAVARLAAERGYDVAINYVSNRDAAESVASLCREAGARVCLCQGNAAVESDIIAMFDKTVAELGRIDHVINNAGVTGRSSRLDRSSSDEIRHCIDINVTGAILVAREAARRLSTRNGGPGGTIVNISSVAAHLGSPGEYVWYAASKGAMDSLTIGLAKELAEEGVRVNAVSPGLTETDIHETSSGDGARLARLTPQIPLKRPGSPEEIAEAVLFLVSPASSYMLGANLRVSGGR